MAHGVDVRGAGADDAEAALAPHRQPPELALFYGGMVRAKNVLAVMMNNFVAIGVVTVLWVLVAGSLDVLGVHGVGGLTGMLLLGLFATKSINRQVSLRTPPMALPASVS